MEGLDIDRQHAFWSRSLYCCGHSTAEMSKSVAVHLFVVLRCVMVNREASSVSVVVFVKACIIQLNNTIRKEASNRNVATVRLPIGRVVCESARRVRPRKAQLTIINLVVFLERRLLVEADSIIIV